MSFILDALKKSESDRQRQNGPSLFEVKVAPPRRTLPIWAVAIAVLLGINAIVVTWMLLRRGPAQQPAAAAAPAATPAPAKVARTASPTTSGETAAAPGTADSASSAGTAAAANPTTGSTVAFGRSTPESARPPGAALGTASADQSAGAPATTATPLAGSADQGPAQTSSGGSPSDYAPAVEPPAAQGAGASDAATGDLPLYQQIVTSEGLPALHLDLHVFAARPKDRFVMINMERLGEGDSLPNGVQVEAIRPDGVVLSYHGTRFLLPRN
jgi:general secretion pathway protein B